MKTGAFGSLEQKRNWKKISQKLNNHHAITMIDQFQTREEAHAASSFWPIGVCWPVGERQPEW